jgi:glycerophosphoryl diester phosphodiesterase
MQIRAITSVACAIGLASLGCSSVPSKPPDNNCLPDDNFLCGGPLNIAHRGGANLRPEGTMVAFENAMAIGVDVLEMDVRRTADGIPVVIHDTTVDRTTDGTGTVSTLTLAAIQQLDAGHDFTPDSGTSHPYRGMGIHVPTLEQVLTAFPTAHFSIEIKDGVTTVEPVLALISSLGIEDRVVIASFLDNVIQKVRTDAPDVLTTMSLLEMATFYGLTDADEATYVLPAPIIQAPFLQITDDTLARAELHHLVVQAWTVDDDATMTDLLTRGVDGIITNEPDRLRDVITTMTP